ncbi:MAG: hypothetical protein QMA93_07360, partial [Acidimicrobiales bacterium]
IRMNGTRQSPRVHGPTAKKIETTDLGRYRMFPLHRRSSEVGIRRASPGGVAGSVRLAMGHADKVTYFVVNNISHHIIHQVLQTSASEARNAASQGVEIDIRN